jgi:transposase-like protein
LATYILSVHSKGISSLQLASLLGVTQKTAWHLNHRIREMLTDKAPELLGDIIEIDECYIVKGGTGNKTMVLGAVQRNGKLRTRVIPETNAEMVEKTIQDLVAPDSTMVTDEHRAYINVGKKYNHKQINHKDKQYVRREKDLLVHTNNIEGYWNILRKQLDGIHHSVSPKHLQRYCNESAFRYNNRSLFQDERFAQVLANCNGKLDYKTLTATI